MSDESEIQEARYQTRLDRQTADELRDAVGETVIRVDAWRCDGHLDARVRFTFASGRFLDLRGDGYVARSQADRVPPVTPTDGDYDEQDREDAAAEESKLWTWEDFVRGYEFHGLPEPGGYDGRLDPKWAHIMCEASSRAVVCQHCGRDITPENQGFVVAGRTTVNGGLILGLLGGVNIWGACCTAMIPPKPEAKP
jgi:hypothetical protein